MGLIFPFRGVAYLPSFPSTWSSQNGITEREELCYQFHEAKQHPRPYEACTVSYMNQWALKNLERNRFIPQIYLYWTYTLILEKCLYIIHEYCCWNMENLIALLFVSSYGWKINGLLKQTNHHLAAVTGRTDSKTHICCAQYFCLLFFLLTEWNKILIGVSDRC